MATENKILTAEQELKLRQPIDEYVGGIQAKIDALRVDGTDRVIDIQSMLDNLKRDRIYTAQEKEARAAQLKKELEAAKAVENQNKAEISKLIADAESYLKAHYDAEYYQPLLASCRNEKVAAQEKYQAAVAELNKEHQATLSKLTDQHEIKDEKYVHKNRLFDAKMTLAKDLQQVKDRQHAAFDYKYHLIDMLRMSKFTFGETMAQKWENYKYTFNKRDFFLKNGLYLAIIVIFIALCIITPIVKNTQLLTMNNVLNILQQASPRMFLALGVAGLILLAGTDLSIGRMVGMGMTAATIIMHQGINTGSVFGHIFDFTGLPVVARILLALVVCIVLCTIFTTIAGFFTAKFKMHPFISTMANMLVIFGLVTYSTKGVSFGAIDPSIPSMIIPRIGKFPTIILWAVAAIIIVWFIWNKTTFGKNLYAVGGNPEAASVSGISVFLVTVGAFVMAGILYGFGSWLECIRMVGSGSAAYGQGWEMDAIAACVVGGISFTGGIGKISGVVVGVFIFTALTYSLTILGIDTNLQFVFSGIIILVAVTLDCLKYVQKK
ncbi:MAG: galactoside ABC transporter permease [Flintibacter sp.]|uniref:ABC transporter permease subunit n=1 Tax=Flintibacter sp. TaxID=1918624 RepID=UPI0001E8E480|nr:galactoside ABC transporter permease [Flintibacter sp.]EGJ47547.1 methyl-galactoside transport system permease [Ruminococcaceae bacterium D16]MCI6149495.1 galactoside ABC transporter permease [Flintibacter sp.]MDD7116913.1 galactoside ABC transporter permease [Flintibacter sp.]MDY5039135.1 galactoside ABC transporter permease [Lawsonibacter sp.]